MGIATGFFLAWFGGTICGKALALGDSLGTFIGAVLMVLGVPFAVGQMS